MSYIASLVASVVVAFLIGRHYNRKATHKSLTAHLILSADVLDSIEQEVRTKLRVLYESDEVDDLHLLQFVVANTGEIPISRLPEPLTLELPRDSRVLDVAVPRRRPANLLLEPTAAYGEDERPSLVFDFNLLNKGDWFEVRLLIQGRVDSTDLAFRLTGEALPDRLKLQNIPQRVSSMEDYIVMTVFAGALLGFSVLYWKLFPIDHLGGSIIGMGEHIMWLPRIVSGLLELGVITAFFIVTYGIFALAPILIIIGFALKIVRTLNPSAQLVFPDSYHQVADESANRL